MKKKERNVPFEEAQRFAQDCKIQKNLSLTVIEMSVANKYGYHQLNNWVRFVYLKFQKDSRKRINENYIKLSSNLRFILKQKKTMKKKANTSGQPQKSTNTNTNTYTNTNINTKTNTNTNENVMDNSKNNNFLQYVHHNMGDIFTFKGFGQSKIQISKNVNNDPNNQKNDILDGLSLNVPIGKKQNEKKESLRLKKRSVSTSTINNPKAANYLNNRQLNYLKRRKKKKERKKKKPIPNLDIFVDNDAYEQMLNVFSLPLIHNKKPFNQDKSNKNLNVNKKPIPRSKSQEFKPRNYTKIQSFNPKGFIESFNAINSVNNNYIFDHTQDNSLDIGNTNSNMLTNEIWDLDTNVEVENVGSIKNKEQINIEKRYEKNQEKEYKNELGQEQVQKPEQAEVQKQEQAEVYKKGQEWEHDQEYGEDRIENKDKYQGNLENNKINNLMDANENENEKNYNDRKKKKVKNIIGFFDDDELEESEESEESNESEESEESVKNEENEENKEINENEKSVESVEKEENEKNEENNENKKEESVKNEENEENKEINENNKTLTQKSENKSKENINKKEENLLNNKNNDFGITPFQNDGDENGFGYY
ncbi:chromatin assembly factor 1 subunit a [Anaeramoeba flamelloides]|uniref:Chromatin assembly factor 1 subunit a n=1 Tax=Anaeramoeba flamelloides TaxID=1746091 RepID=A0AAV7YHV3_9EUKA|nr:chromatin assembly factor 1 subunit a [Anaeramoeba flamelloides]